ncbi:MAG: TIGR01777 family protein [Elusimicrobia bacterium GWA2_69_24]|nr:MAG: TIGR01777 family protein [Elusimicrobia bacterium GWA2_69_24]HBL15596.1 TIGR01777 family protein [Elusimicrobiota bacterium]
MKIAISGASGFIGSALANALIADGDQVRRIARPYGQDDVDSAVSGADAVVNLAGESISGRWTAEKKAEIRASRLRCTEAVVRSLARVKARPRVLVSASAVGFYGDRAEAVDEKSPTGTGFLAEVCRDWETAALAAEPLGVRVVLPRLGVVLGREGGALAKMLPAFRLGVGGPIGSGRQMMSWISLEDLVRVIRFSISTPGLQGPVNAAAPAPVSNREFTLLLGQAVRRPAVMPLPALVVKTLFGEMGEELLLSGVSALPKKLQIQGFSFHHPGLAQAFAALLG